MLAVLRNRTFRHMFAAQVIAIIGTGLATVALGLIAYDLAGADASIVLSIALTIKMVSYVTLAPIAAAVASQYPRRNWLVTLDILRALVALALPFVSEIWQIYVLIFVMQASSAGFTPAFQATIPDVLSDEEDYTNALSLSRLAYDIESLLSPTLAALLLTLVTANSLFFGTAAGFIASALLVASVVLPSPRPSATTGLYHRTTLGIRIYLKTPRLRGLLGLTVVAASVSAMVIINTVVIIRADLGLSEHMVALTLAAFGAGSMLAAVTLPRLLAQRQDRSLMIAGALIAILAQTGLAAYASLANATVLPVILCWFLSGFGYSTVLTPSGRLLKRSARAEDRPAVFAAQFTLSHGCWLITYPLAGWSMSSFGMVPSLLVLNALAILGVLYARIQWPAHDPESLPHGHPELAADHPHLQAPTDHAQSDPKRHSHPYVIDDLHKTYPPADQ
ncbi:MFS transporter [Pseudophaeobacter arcticus]|uniref:MFS transporter n=1 Tax=Pseudophaeobacter arcticus TaxID=385492 RepID=UPI002492DEA3|nr:MFS transporter [Pseudophaeobacter arcticus]